MSQAAEAGAPAATSSEQDFQSAHGQPEMVQPPEVPHAPTGTQTASAANPSGLPLTASAQAAPGVPAQRESYHSTTADAPGVRVTSMDDWCLNDTFFDAMVAHAASTPEMLKWNAWEKVAFQVIRHYPEAATAQKDDSRFVVRVRDEVNKTVFGPDWRKKVVDPTLRATSAQRRSAPDLQGTATGSTLPDAAPFCPETVSYTHLTLPTTPYV